MHKNKPRRGTGSARVRAKALRALPRPPLENARRSLRSTGERLFRRRSSTPITAATAGALARTRCRTGKPLHGDGSRDKANLTRRTAYRRALRLGAETCCCDRAKKSAQPLFLLPWLTLTAWARWACREPGGSSALRGAGRWHAQTAQMPGLRRTVHGRAGAQVDCLHAQNVR